MFEVLKISEKEIKTISKIEENCWINVIEPTDEEIKKLRKIIDIPEDILNSLKDVDEIPEVIEYPTYSFIIIRTPYNHPKSELTYTTQPLGIFLHDKFVLTICYEVNDVVNDLKTAPFKFKKSQFVLRLLLKSSRIFLTYLKSIHKKMISLEELLEVSQKNKVIMMFLELEKSLVYFNTSIRSNHILIEKLSKNKRLLKHKENIVFLDQIVEETRQGMQMTEVYSDILSNTLDAFASIISNNLNMVMKTLTSLTLIFNIPILIASVYGMNLHLPFQESPHAFFLIMSFSLVMSIFAVYIFAWKRYL